MLGVDVANDVSLGMSESLVKFQSNHYFPASSQTVHRQDHRPALHVLHGGGERVRLCSGDRLHRGHRHGGHDDRLPRLAHPPQGRQGLQDRTDTQAHQGMYGVRTLIPSLHGTSQMHELYTGLG